MSACQSTRKHKLSFVEAENVQKKNALFKQLKLRREIGKINENEKKVSTRLKWLVRAKRKS